MAQASPRFRGGCAAAARSSPASVFWRWGQGKTGAVGFCHLCSGLQLSPYLCIYTHTDLCVRADLHMYVRMCMYTLYVYMHAYMYVYVYIYMYIHSARCSFHMCIFIVLLVYVYVDAYVVDVCVHVHVCVPVHVHAHLHVYVCVYT